MTDDPFSSRMASVAARPKNPWPARIALAIGALVAFIWAFAQTVGSMERSAPAASEPPGYAEGMVAGQILGAGLFIGGIIWLLIYFLLLKPRASRSGPQYFLILAVAAAMGAGLPHAASFLGADTRALQEQLDTTEVQIEADEKALIAELTDIGLTQEDATARAARDLAAATRNVEKAQEIIDKYEALRETRVRELRARAVALGTNGSRRKRYAERVDAMWATTRPFVDRRWALERRALGVREELVALLKRSRGQWRVDGNMVVFFRQKDLADAQLMMNEMHAVDRERAKLKYDVDVLEAKERGDPPPPPPTPDFMGPPTIPTMVSPRP